MESPEHLPPTQSGDAPLSSRPSPLPQRIGRYHILGLLGAGGMGEVYRALDPHLDRQVALKQPRFDGPPADVKRRMERFQREARAAAQVLHPHVCPIFDVGEHEGRPFVVMALVEGQSLAQHLASHPGPLDVGAAVTLARQLLDGLGAVHERGTVHRDIKPANILLDAAGRPFLTDFGLARLESPTSPFTSEGVIVGTPFYMAPEQAAGHAEEVGPWTDLYAVGVVLYEMLTGTRPFRATGPAVLAQILRDEPPAPRKLRPNLDAGLEAIVLRALHKKPRERFSDARAFAQALEPWAAPRGHARTNSAGLPAAEATTAWIREEQPRSSRRHWRIGAAVCGMAGIGLLAAAGLTALLGEGTHAVNYAAGSSLALAAGLVCWTFGPRLRWPARGLTITRLGGWLAGGALVAVGMGLLALAVLTALQGVWILLFPCTFFSFIGLWLGIFGPWHTTEKGYTSEGLLRGASFGYAALARRALANGVAPDGRDDMEETALMHAATRGHTEIVKLLLVHGANPVLRNRFGQTARDMADANGRSDVVALLSQAVVPTTVTGADLPRFAPRSALVACALAGGLIAIVLLGRIDLVPAVITPEAYRQLREKRLVKSQTETHSGEEKWLEGELTTLDSPVVRALELTKRTFMLPLNDAALPRLAVNAPGDNVPTAVRTGNGLRSLRVPTWWQALVMTAVPVIVAVLIGRVLSPIRLLIGKD